MLAVKNYFIDFTSDQLYFIVYDSSMRLVFKASKAKNTIDQLIAGLEK